MPVSGEMRLRQLILAVVALGGIWVGIAVQQDDQHAPVRAAFAAGPAPPDFPAPKQPKLVRVPGLNRPASLTPIAVKAPPQPYVHHAAPKAARPAKTHRLKTKRAQQTQPSGVEPIPEDTRDYAESPPPPLEPLEITNVQV